MQLQAEMDRMAQHTRQPEVLRELFEAFGNDPFVVAECLARPLLAERLLRRRRASQVKQVNAQTDEQRCSCHRRVIASHPISADGGCSR